MLNTIERTLTTASDSVTERLDSLEQSLPDIPSKALAATRASARRVTDVVGSAASSVWSRTEAVGDDVEGALDDAKVAADPSDLSKWSKADLYERAQELDIDGRSAMTKAELVGAIEKS